MQSDLLLLLFTPNLISILIWIAVTLTLIPNRPLFGSLLWMFLFILTIFYFPSSQTYVDKGVADAFGEAILYLLVMAILIGFGAWTIIKIIIDLISSPRKISKEDTKFFKKFNQIIFTAYGFLLGFWIFLFSADFLENYQPAWEAYVIAFLFDIFFLLLFIIVKNHSKCSKYIQQYQIHFLAYKILME